MPHGATRGCTGVIQDTKGKRLYCSFWGKEQLRQGKQAQDWLV